MIDLTELRFRGRYAMETEDQAANRRNRLKDEAAAEVESLRDRLSFAEFEWHRATDGMKERDAQIEGLRSQLESETERASQWFDECAKQAGKAFELSQQLANEQWQPIETAPKDGTTIDLWCRNISHGSTGAVRAPDSFWDDEVQKWEDRHGWILETKWKPTHWMPLPAGPKLALSDERGTV